MEQEILIPQSLNDISLEQYQALMRVKNDTDNEMFIAQKMVALFCKIRMSDVLRIRKIDVDDIVSKMTTILESDKPFIQRFKMNDVEFGFIPDLENMLFEEFVDAETYIGDWETMHKAMAVLYRPITKRKGDKYDIEKYQSAINYEEVMRFAPLSVALGAMVFFYRLNSELLTASLDYSIAEAAKMISMKSHSSTNNGDGITQSIHLQRETLEHLTRLLRSPLLSALPS